jgi:outer membrane protein TolC
MIKKLTVSCFIIAITGCASYKPINTQNSNSPQQLQLQAQQLKHLLLKPIILDLKNGLSPDEAAILAVLENPQLRVERNKLSIANAQLLQAGLLPNPTISYNLANTTGGLDSGKVQGYGLSLNWDITALLSQANKINAAQKDKQSINLQLAWQEWQIAQAAKLACYQLQFYMQQQTLLNADLIKLEADNQKNSQAFAQNLITASDTIATRAMQSDLKTRWQTLDEQIQLQQEKLKRLLGLSAQETISFEIIKPILTNSIPNYWQLINNLSQQRLDLLALQQGYQAQDEQVRVAILQQFPKINIGLTHSKNNSDYYTMGAGISLSLPVFDQNQGAIAIATANRQMLFDEYTNRDFQTKADIAQLLITIDAINKEITLSNTALADLEDLVNNYTAALKQGQLDNATYYSAWHKLNDKKVDLLTLQLHLIEARVALETTTGRYNL